MEDLTLNVFMAIQAGIDVAGTNADLVPKDRFIACTQFPQQEDKDMIIGYWDTRDANGNKVYSSMDCTGITRLYLHWYFYHQYPKGLLQ